MGSCLNDRWSESPYLQVSKSEPWTKTSFMTGGPTVMTGGPKAWTDGLQDTSVTGGLDFFHGPDCEVAL
jgi:hypothetical protein